VLDQTELVRLVRQGPFVHTVQHAVRGPAVAIHAEDAERLAFLKAATISSAPPPVPPDPTPEPPDVLALADELLSGSPPSGAPGRAAALRRVVGQVTHRRDPVRLATLRLLLGAELMAAGGDALDEAIDEYRRALAVLRPGVHDPLRAHALHLVGDAWSQRCGTAGHDAAEVARDRSHAVACLRAAEAFLASGSSSWGTVVLDRAMVELAAGPCPGTRSAPGARPGAGDSTARVSPRVGVVPVVVGAEMAGRGQGVAGRARMRVRTSASSS
jgi:hypothetical protein